MSTSFVSLDELTEKARKLGLEVGASSAPPGAEASNLKRWLADGHHAEMTWLERDPDRRADPRLVLEGAQSVVSLGMNYFQGDLPESDLARPTGRIARYALGDDYHGVMLDKVRELAR